VWVSSDGNNVFISDASALANVVRQVIRSTGIISTLPGTTGGVLYSPYGFGIWGDSIGNLFIADTYHYQIKMLSLKTQNLSTIAGTGNSSDTGDGGSPTSATFTLPSSIWGDSDGLFFFIADPDAHKIRIIDKSLSIIYTVAGTGTRYPSGSDGLSATSTNIYYPAGVWGNTAKNIFITEYFGNKARKLYLPPNPTSPSQSSSFFKITIDTSTINPALVADCPLLNIAEVSFFKNSIQLSNSLFTFVASCFATSFANTNGSSIYANYNDIYTIFHSCDKGLPGCNGKNDNHPYLNMTVSDSYSFDTITITNRQDCIAICQARMVGAHLKVYHSSDLNQPLWSTTISTNQTLYTFSTQTIYGKDIP
jgi:hypothetical protein